MASVARRHELDMPQTPLQVAFRHDVLAGLSQERKAIPARWFYDLRGSQLFDAITELPEYYPTRAEIEILSDQAVALVHAIGRYHAVVEFGSGSATKTPLLLDAIEASAYVPVDISGEYLRCSCDVLARRYPYLPIFPIEADFTLPFAIPSELHGHERLGFFPGSTIGNLEPHAAVDMLRGMRNTLGDGSLLLIGMDLIKSRDTLLAAYDDAAGLTAAFNLNLAHRINCELDGTIPVNLLRHRAIWDDARARIEMHMEAVQDMSFHICGRYFTLLAGETIHTENSHKYDERAANLLLLAGGWKPQQYFTDSAQRFAVVLARAAEHCVTA